MHYNKLCFLHIFTLAVCFLFDSALSSRYQGNCNIWAHAYNRDAPVPCSLQSPQPATHIPPCPNIKVTNGRVKFRQRGRFAKFSCNVGYMLAGERYSICSNGKWDMSAPKCVRATCMKTPRAPANGLIFPSHGGAVLNFYCRPGYQLHGPLVIYCDGRQWDNHLPSCLPNGTKPKLFCDFEEPDICDWTHDLNHDFDWRRENYQTPSGSIGTGPSFDHTKGKGKNGYYMYIESSSRNENDTARLISPVFDKTEEDTCLEFFYHMFGATTGTLRVYLKKASDPWPLQASSAIFSKSGNQGDKWYRSFHSLGMVDEDFQIIIEGVRGPGYVSDIAIDDVRIIENCVEEDYMTTEETSVSSVSSELPPNVESCENRCGTKDLGNASRQLISCDCDDSCSDNKRCCPDYLDFCVLTDLSTTEWYTSTDISNDISLTNQMKERQNSEIQRITTTSTERNINVYTSAATKLKYLPPVTKPSTKKNVMLITSTTAKTTPKKVVNNITKPSVKITKKLVNSTSTTRSTLNKITLKTTTTEKKLTILPPKKTVSAVKKTDQFIPTKPSILILTEPPTTHKIVRKLFTKPTKSTKLIFVKPIKPTKSIIINNDVVEVPQKIDDKDETLLLTSPVPAEDEEDDGSFFDKEDYADELAKMKFESPYLKKNWAEKEKLFTEKDDDTDHHKWILILSVFGSVMAALSFLGIIVVWIRRNRLNQCRTRRMNSGNGDSQSDVRFLTGDETLDFTLDRDYDDL